MGPNEGGGTAEFEDRVVLVTGAASGIGRATAQRFAHAGAVVIATDVDDDAGATLVRELSADGHRARYHHLDVADPAAWAGLVDEIAAEHARLDIVHLNAGIRLGAGDLTALEVDDYLRLVGINQHGVFFGLRATVELLEASAGGAVVVTASRASIGPLPNDLPYAMAKHAVTGLVRSAAEDLAARGISINALCPATVDTGFLGGVGRDRLEAAGIEVMDAAEVAEGVVAVLGSGRTGELFVQLPAGRPEPFTFAPVPGR